jgi:hypothetical protein
LRAVVLNSQERTSGELAEVLQAPRSKESLALKQLRREQPETVVLEMFLDAVHELVDSTGESGAGMSSITSRSAFSL